MLQQMDNFKQSPNAFERLTDVCEQAKRKEYADWVRELDTIVKT
jgi:hypothetical protein